MMRTEASFTACWLTVDKSDVKVDTHDGDVCLTQGDSYVSIPLAEAAEFADALRAWVVQQEEAQQEEAA